MVNAYFGLFVIGHAARSRRARCETRVAGLAWVLRDGGSAGVALYLIGALSGAGMVAAFSPLMTRVLLRVPVLALA